MPVGDGPVGGPVGGAVGGDDVRFRTERLVVVRRWRDVDRDAYAAMNADPEVMTHLGGPLSRERSDSLARYGEGWAERAGMGLLPVVRVADGVLLGMCGLHRQRWYPDEVEIGWRFARHAWGHGYATEVARCWLDEAFGPLGLDHVISITHPENLRSIAVMRRLGMRLRDAAVHRDGDLGEVPVVVHVLTADDRATAAGAG